MLIFVFAIAKLTRLNELLARSTVYTVELNVLEEGFNFFERFIIVKHLNDIKVLSSKCTHLGCRINKYEGNELVCPCHGSRYNQNGVAVQGPAPRALETPAFEISGDKIIITFAAG